VNHQQGFTLIEALVALGIAATALVVLTGRLGASADVQRSLGLHALALDVAANQLAEQSLQSSISGDEQSGTTEADGISIDWRSWTEQTMLDGFVRRNIAVRVPGEPEVKLFLYQEVR
jgi:type II secretion system protein I